MLTDADKLHPVLMSSLEDTDASARLEVLIANIRRDVDRLKCWNWDEVRRTKRAAEDQFGDIVHHLLRPCCDVLIATAERQLAADRNFHGAFAVWKSLDIVLVTLVELQNCMPGLEARTEKVRTATQLINAAMFWSSVADTRLMRSQFANVEATSERVANAIHSVEFATTRSQQATERAEQAIGKLIVARESSHFHGSADEHALKARSWGMGAAVIAIVLCGLAAYAVWWGSAPPLASEAWYLAANVSHYGARLLAISVFSFALVFCARNYRACQHNRIVDAHRGRALAAYKDIIESLPDGADRRIVLTYSADAIFNPRESGYGDTGPVSSSHAAEALMGVGVRQ